MRKKGFALLIGIVMFLSLSSQAFAAPSSIATSCGVAKGTASSPIRICSSEDLKLLASYPSSHFLLKNSIAVNEAWSPVPSFSGTFNGNHKTISGLQDSLIDQNYGTIRNLILSSSVLHDQRGALSFANYGFVSNLKVYGEVYGDNAGGIASLNEGIIEYSSSFAEIGGKSVTGGIAARNGKNGIIRNSHFSGEAGAFAQSGGITAFNEGLIANSFSWGKVSVVSGGAGGVVAHNYPGGVIRTSWSAGEVHYLYEPRLDVGKFAGKNSGIIVNPIITNHVYADGVLVE